MKQAFAQLLNQRPVVFDGAMGTELYKKGFFINVSYEELCLKNPDIVREIHRENKDAGADVLTTNSFGANRFKLSDFLIGNQAAEIARASASLAREVAGSELWVAGSVGPIGKPVGVPGGIADDEVLEAYIEVMEALQSGGVDFILLETFSRAAEIRLAARAATMLDIPFIPSMAFSDANVTRNGDSVQEFFAPFVDGTYSPLMLGFNCGVGPKQMLENVTDFLHQAKLPILVQPNSGYPQVVNDRMMQMASPEYFATYAQRFIDNGARAIGGCCGTGPAHIAEASRAVKSFSKFQQQKSVIAFSSKTVIPSEPVPLQDRSGFAAKLARGEWVSSVEIVPPLSWDLSKIVEKARICRERGVDAINIPDGPRASARISPMVAAHAIQQNAGIEAVLHVTCRDRNLIGVQSDLLGCASLGINNLLIITGDPPKLGDYPFATAVFDLDSIGLTKMVSQLNTGIDIGGKEVKPATRFCKGVGADPTNLDQERELSRLRQKIEAGAEFIITQPVYDPDALKRFLDRIAHFSIPVIAGVWPLASAQNARFLQNEVPGVVIPNDIFARMERAADKDSAKQVGIEIAREAIEAVRPLVAGVQVSAPFGNVETALKVMQF